jgi:two-component system sensor histidine kinase VicK
MPSTDTSTDIFNSICDHSPALLWISGKDAGCEFFSKSWLDFTGRSFDEVKGNGWIEDVHPDDVPTYMHTYISAFDEKIKFTAEFRLRRHDGEYRWLYTAAVPLFDADNIFQGFSGSCMDIHDKIETEKQQDKFLNVASHDLRTPVTTMKIYVQLMEEQLQKSGNELQLPYIQKIEQQLNKLNGLIGNLLDVSRMQTGKFHVNVEAVDIDEIIEKAIKQVTPTLKKHQVVLNGKAKKMVDGEDTRLLQVMNNLIDNAVKFSPKGGTVTIDVSNEDEGCVIKITDEGIGIDEADQPNIFDRYYKMNKNDKNFPGLGIGLFTSKSIVEGSGGTLHVESKKGAGSTFITWLQFAE